MTGLLVALLLTALAGSVFPPIGDWLESVRFGGPALMAGLALLFVELLTSERQALEEERVFEDSLKLTEAFADAANNRSITIDFAGDSAETFKLLLRETLRRTSTSRAPIESLRVRIMVPDLGSPIAVPASVDSLQDDPDYRAENWQRTRASLAHIASDIESTFNDHGIRSADLELRFHHLVPTVKLYVLNNRQAFWALYRIEKRPNAGRPDSPVWDTRGTNATVFSVSPGPDILRQHQFDAMTQWFDTLWSTVAYEMQDVPTRRWTRDSPWTEPL